LRVIRCGAALGMAVVRVYFFATSACQVSSTGRMEPDIFPGEIGLLRN